MIRSSFGRTWLLDNSFQKILKLHLLDGDDQDVDVGDPADELQISASPLGHGSLVEDAEGKLVAQVRDMLDPANITKNVTSLKLTPTKVFPPVMGSVAEAC